MGIAAEVSFWGVLSVVPLLLVVASALGWLDSVAGFEQADAARRELTEQIENLLGFESDAVRAVDELFESPSTGSFTFGLITAIYAASRGFTSLIGGLDHIAGRERTRSWLMTRVSGITIAILSIAFMVAMLIFIGVGRTGFGLADPWGSIVSIALWPVGLAIVSLWAAVLLHWAPREKTPLIYDLPGAVLTALAWLIGSYLTALYIRRTSSGTDVLGLLGSGVGLLIWLYVISASILIGAQTNAAMRAESTGRPAPGSVEECNSSDQQEHDVRTTG